MSVRVRYGSSSGSLGNDRGAAGRQRLDQLGLRAGDVLDRADELEVDRARCS